MNFIRAISRLLAPRSVCASTILFLLLTANVQAQVTSGSNAVWASSTLTTGTTAFIDASVFYTTDVCSAMDYIYSNVLTSSAFPQGGTIDARGITPSTECGINPFRSAKVPSTVLLPPGTIVIDTTWVLPDRTQMIGAGRTQTTIQVSTMNFPTHMNPPAFMIQMCPNGDTCSGVVISDLYVYGAGDLSPASPPAIVVSGIYNNGAQDSSYVSNVTVAFAEGTGLDVEAGGANSGPYWNFDVTEGGTGGTPPKCTSSNQYCGETLTTNPVEIGAGTTTRGIHGFTFTGDGGDGPTFYGPAAGIYLDGNNNTIEDGHFEGMNVGIAVGAHHAAAGNQILNITGASGGGTSGPMRNVVYICSAGDSNQPCTSTSGAVSDLTLSQIQSYTTDQLLLQDDETHTTLTSQNSSGLSDAGVGMYFLGESVSSGSFSGYSRFSTFFLSAGGINDQTPGVPTWAFGDSAPSTPCPNGAIFSNRNGSGTFQTIFVCVSGNWVGVK